MSDNNISMNKAKRKAVSQAVWGAVPPVVREAQALGGDVVRAGGIGGGSSSASPRAGDDCLALVRRLVAPDEVANAHALGVMGERRAAREAREDIFVRALGAWVGCAGAVAVLDVVNGLALLLGVSPATIKRYLARHASPFGRFVVDGDFVRLRRD